MREVTQDRSFKYETHFVHDNHQFVNDNGTTKLSASTEYEENVKILILSRLEIVKKQFNHVDLFPTNAIMSIRRRAVSITNPDKHAQHLLKKREHSVSYEQNPEKRKEIEAKRYATAKRKEYEEEFVSSGKS